MILYVVHRVGIYEQGVFGIYSTPEAAIERANELAKNDTDSHHDWVVYSAELDFSPEVAKEQFSYHKNYVAPYSDNIIYKTNKAKEQ